MSAAVQQCSSAAVQQCSRTTKRYSLGVCVRVFVCVRVHEQSRATPFVRSFVRSTPFAVRQSLCFRSPFVVATARCE